MTATAPQSDAVPSSPLFTLIVSVYNMAEYLPAFLSSLDAQTIARADFEIVFVNDGSVDASETLLHAWVERTDCRARVISQPNGGLSAARNTGLAAASDGRWVSFPDPDDVLDPEYLAIVKSYLRKQRNQPHLVSTHVLLFDDVVGAASDTHPLAAKFQLGNRVVNMERNPEVIHLQAASGFYRRKMIDRLDLRFDETIKPNFEDSYFTAMYLSSVDEPLLAVVADAYYFYRRRADGGSLVQQSWAKEAKYSTLLEVGYLRLLEEIKRRRGSVPVWAQNTVLYDFYFYFRHEQSTHGPTAIAKPEWSERFHELAKRILAHIDIDTIEAYSILPTTRQLKDALIIGYHRQRLVPEKLRLIRIDRDQQIIQMRYFYGDELPVERFFADGCEIEPLFAKIRDLSYFDRVLLRERIVWLPALAEISVSLNDRRMPLEFGPAPDPVYSASANLAWRSLTKRRRAPQVAALQPLPTDGVQAILRQRLAAIVHARAPQAVPVIRKLRGRFVRPAVSDVVVRPGPFAELDPRHDEETRKAAHSGRTRARYGDAWTFIDRDTEAHDNAEHLFRHVQQHHPEINAWFVLRRESSDWDRLAADGFRLVPFGSAEHVKLLLNTSHLISSQVDHYIVRPLDERRFGRKAWRFTFLQHGVTKDDLSRWLNSKPISRFITATRAEHESIAGDHTPYVFTEKETRLTGFPRHDRLLTLRRDVTRPNLILIMPTWRRWLMRDAEGGNARALKRPLAQTKFWRSWLSLISSGALRETADRADLEIAFLPHPNMQTHFRESDVPSWVQIRTYDQADVQELMARAAVAVTDYSSQAFEAAYVEAPVVYYQFDHDDFFSGSHVYRKGYWDYQSDGFGPVVFDLDGALSAVDDAVRLGEPQEPYRSRMREAFVHRDGRCCERTVLSIKELTEAVPT